MANSYYEKIANVRKYAIVSDIFDSVFEVFIKSDWNDFDNYFALRELLVKTEDAVKKYYAKEKT